MHHAYYDELKRMKRTRLHDFLAGFVDGEGSFNVSFSPIANLRWGWIINPKFQVYQHEHHRDILEIFRDVFQTGTIRKKSGSNVLVYEIADRRSLTEKVIPFFERYPLATKRAAFERFRFIIERMNAKAHLTADGFREIVRIAHRMNAEGKGRKWDEVKLTALLDAEPSETIRRTHPYSNRVRGKIASNPPGDRRGNMPKVA